MSYCVNKWYSAEDKCLNDGGMDASVGGASTQSFEMKSSVDPNLEEEPVFLSTVFPLSERAEVRWI